MLKYKTRIKRVQVAMTIDDVALRAFNEWYNMDNPKPTFLMVLRYYTNAYVEGLDIYKVPRPNRKKLLKDNI